MLNVFFSADNEEILKTLQRKETEMKILHGKDASIPFVTQSYNSH